MVRFIRRFYLLIATAVGIKIFLLTRNLEHVAFYVNQTVVWNQNNREFYNSVLTSCTGTVASKLIPYKVFLVYVPLYVLLNLQKLKMLFDIYHFHYCMDKRMVVLLYVSSYEPSMLPLEKKIFHKLHNHRVLNQCANTFNRSGPFKNRKRRRIFRRPQRR